MNKEIIKLLNDVGLSIKEIFLPKDNFEKFSVIAVDQFVENRKYWEDVKKFVGDSKSSLNIVFPETYLPFNADNLQKIKNTMDEYFIDGTLKSIGECFVYVKRNTSAGIRKGLVVAIDLEQYDYNKNSKSLIRPTELTVKERLPIRVEIRKNSSIDIPHVMLLIEDKKNELFNYIDNTCVSEKIYDFNLMMDGGHIEGYKITDEEKFYNIAKIFEELKGKAKDNLLYAIGDGNHSLAAAKMCYEKGIGGRYALVEIVNIYDSGLNFYPIHRVLQNVDKYEIIKELSIDMNKLPPLNELQEKIDDYLEKHKEAKLEYIHGKDIAEKLGSMENNIAFIYNKFDYEKLFDTVIKYGSLCRKSFSIGKNIDKRYYLESTRI